MKKLILIPVLLLLILATPLVNASATTIAESNNAANTNIAFAYQWGTCTNSSSVAFGQVFTAASTGYLTNITLKANRMGTIEGSLTAYIYDDIGTYGTDAHSIGGPLATSNTISTSSWEQSPATGNVVFTFDQTYLMTSGQKYCVEVHITSQGTILNTAYLSFWGEAAYAGNGYKLQGDGTYAALAFDLFFKVEGDTEEAAETPGPLPTGGSYDTSDTNALINTFAGYMIPLLLWLIPALIMGYVTHWAKWPILIGLAIGGGLCYLFLGTQYVWMVFVTVIGLVGMAYQSSRGGGGTH